MDPSTLVGSCRDYKCPVQHRHPITGLPPDYHFLGRGGMEPRWHKRSYKPNPLRMWYSTKEAAHVMGLEVQTVRRWIHSGRLKYTVVGPKCFRIHADAIREAMELPWLGVKTSERSSRAQTRKSAPL